MEESADRSMRVTLADDWRSGNRKLFMTSSGKVVKIKKLQQRDFFPDKLVSLGLEQVMTPEERRAWYMEHQVEVEQHEVMILIRGVVEPTLSREEGVGLDGAPLLPVSEVSMRDRHEILEALYDWSGMTEEQVGKASSTQPGSGPS